MARLGGDYSHLSVQIDPMLLGADDGDIARLDFDNDAINSGGAERVLANALVSAGRMLSAGGLDPAAQRIVARAQSDMLRSMLIALPRRGRSETEVVPYCVRKVEAHMRRNLTEELDLEDLVRISGVSRRSLHAGFRRFRGSTPMKCFKDMRLAAAHADLLQAEGRDGSVTEVATRYNFFQLSKFSRDFQSSFGRLPSQVKRQQGVPVMGLHSPDEGVTSTVCREIDLCRDNGPFARQAAPIACNDCSEQGHSWRLGALAG